MVILTGKRLGEEIDEVIDAGLDRLHDIIAAKLGSDPALVKPEYEVPQGLEPSDRRRRVQDAVEDAAWSDPDFGTVPVALLTMLEEASNSALSTAVIGLRAAKGVQIGNFNAQTDMF